MMTYTFADEELVLLNEVVKHFQTGGAQIELSNLERIGLVSILQAAAALAEVDNAPSTLRKRAVLTRP